MTERMTDSTDVDDTPGETCLKEQMESPSLLTLPAELRNRVYQLVLVKDKHIEVKRLEDRTVEKRALAFLQTCRQIRSEALPVYYAMNSFRFVCIYNHVKAGSLENFVRAVGCDSLKCCKSISLVGRLQSYKYAGCSLLRGYCFASIEVDLSTMMVSSTSKTTCCGADADLQETVRFLQTGLNHFISGKTNLGTPHRAVSSLLKRCHLHTSFMFE